MKQDMPEAPSGARWMKALVIGTEEAVAVPRGAFESADVVIVAGTGRIIKFRDGPLPQPPVDLKVLATALRKFAPDLAEDLVRRWERAADLAPLLACLRGDA